MPNPVNHDNEKIIANLTATNGQNIWIRVGTLLNGFSNKAVKNAHIIYNANEILYVDSADNPPPSDLIASGQNQPHLELPDYTLLPGLIDAHAHLFLEGGELDIRKRQAFLQQTPDDLLQSAHKRLEKLIRLGVVAVRDAGDKHGVGLALSKLYESKDKPLMPYVDSPGAAINHRGHYGGFLSEPSEDYPSLKKCVESRVQAGAARIKLIATGIIDFKAGQVTKQPQMTTAEVTTLVEAAKAFGKQTFAHASGDAGIENVIAGGVDSVEHGFFILEDQLARMRDRQIAWVPTFAPVQAQLDYADLMEWDESVKANLQKILDQHAASLVKANALGVQIIAGSDAGSLGVPHGWGLFYELELMERAGLSPLTVINSATGKSTTRLGFKEKFGKIQPCYRSRFILTRNSPLENIANLRKDKYVVCDGAVYYFAGEFDEEGL